MVALSFVVIAAGSFSDSGREDTPQSPLFH